ncbi:MULTISPECIES: WxL protein peptidoglycan domain-containing protein [Streptomyces]|uniref:WxL protein peptidoglycan domain-containing protein n=1 Tax=Streptomyces TaxID=1883 RepID=UPI000CD49D9C|nr:MULTISPECIES: DUF916 domain-containing protein [Streptomyces]
MRLALRPAAGPARTPLRRGRRTPTARTPGARTSTARTSAATGLALLLALLAGPAGAATAQPPSAGYSRQQQEADSRLTWGVVPAGEDGADGRVSLRLEAEPGSAHRDFVEVTNFSDRPVTFSLTASDGVIVDSGEFDLLPRSEEPVGGGSWITIQEELSLDGRSSAVVPFTLEVPHDALPGDHPGGIAVSVLTTGEDDRGNAVALDARVGVRTHLRVAGELAPRVELTDVRATYRTSWNPFRPGTVEVSWTVANTGNVRLGSAQDVEVAGPFGLGSATGPAVAEQREVLPGGNGTEERYAAEVWPLGRLSAQITAEQRTVGEDVVEAALRDAHARARVIAVPWPQLGLLALVPLTVVAHRWRRRRQRERLAEAVAAARADQAPSPEIPSP